MTNNNSQKGLTALTTRGFAVTVIIAIVAASLLLGGVVYYANKSNETEKMLEDKAMMEQKEKDAMMEKKDGEMMKDDLMMKKDEGAMMDPSMNSGQAKGETMMKHSGVMLAGKSSPLLDFTKADYEAAIKTDKLVVLYFYANWCPICKEEVKSALYPAFNELTTDKVIGIRINYKDSDTTPDEVELARQFGVSYQHTKVFLKNGKQVLKAPDSWNKMRYLEEINKAIGR